MTDQPAPLRSSITQNDDTAATAIASTQIQPSALCRRVPFFAVS